MKVDKISLKITAILWSLMTFSGYQTFYFFTFSTLKKLNIIAGICAHIVHFFFLWWMIQTVRFIYIRRNEAIIRRGIILGCSYGILAGAVLILVWPGLWSWDDIVILTAAQSYTPVPWQHFISSIFHEMALLTLPFPTGVLIVQIIIAALIVGYVGTMLAEVLIGRDKNKYAFGAVIILISLSFPVLVYTLSGFRMGIYAFVEMFLLVRMYVLYKQGCTLDKEELVKILFLTIIIGTWRTEAIFYPLLIYIPLSLMKKCFPNRHLIIYLMIALMIIMGVNKINSSLIGFGSHTKDDYALLSSMVGTVELIRNDTRILSEYDEKIIEKILDVQTIKNKGDYTAEQLFWSNDLNVIKKNYSQDDLREYYFVYTKMLLKHPLVVTKPMIDIFEKSMGLINNDEGKSLQRTLQEPTQMIFSQRESESAKKWEHVLGLGKEPLNLELRTNVVNFLFGTDNQYKKNIIGLILFNVVIPVVFLMLYFVRQLYKKRYFETGIALLILMRVPIIFFTAPAPYLMYYLSIYLCSYVFVVAFLFLNITMLKK